MAPRKPKVEAVERTEICKTCRYSQFDDGEFICRRHAPIGSYESHYIWPAVAADDWCGDFTPKLSS